MYQCAACGLLSLREQNCHGCGGRTMLDLELEEDGVPEGMGVVPGLEEAAEVLQEVAPDDTPAGPTPEEDQEADSSLPFGFGGLARAYVSSLPFGTGASSMGLAHLEVVNEEEDWTEDADETPSAVVEPQAQPDSSVPPSTIRVDPLPDSSQKVEEVPPESSVAGDQGGQVSTTLVVPELWSSSQAEIRSVYGWTSRDAAMHEEDPGSPLVVVEAVPIPEPEPAPAWPEFVVLTPEAELLSGPHRGDVIQAFRALTSSDWPATIQRMSGLLEAGADGASLRTALGIALVESGQHGGPETMQEGLEALKQAAKLDAGSSATLANLAVALAINGRLDALITVVGRLNEGGDLDPHAIRASKALELAKNQAS